MPARHVSEGAATADIAIWRRFRGIDPTLSNWACAAYATPCFSQCVHSSRPDNIFVLKSKETDTAATLGFVRVPCHWRSDTSETMPTGTPSLMHASRNTPPPDDTASQRYQQARDAYLAADYDAALHGLYPLLRERPLDVSVNKLVGYSHFAREEYALALAPLSSVSLFAPDDPEPMLICAQCLAKLGDGALARDLAIHALETARESAAHAHIGANAERFLASI